MPPLSNWDTVLNAVLVMSAAINFFSASFFWKMRATFVSQTDMKNLEAKWELRHQEHEKEIEVSTHEIEKRVRLTEVGIATLGGDIRNVASAVTRVEHQVGLLVEYRLYESKAQ